MDFNNKITSTLIEYSKPLKTEKTLLTKIFKMPVREIKEKPGRTFKVIWDKRFPLLKNFTNSYSYVVIFKNEQKHAGNHYHKEKEELFYCLSGEVLIILQDIINKRREEIRLKDSENKVLFIPKGIGHVIISKAPNTIFLVIASNPSTEGDEIFYKLI